MKKTDSLGNIVTLSETLYTCVCTWPEILSAVSQDIYYEPLRIITSEQHPDPECVYVTPNFEEERVWYCGIRRSWIKKHIFSKDKETTTLNKIRERGIR